MANLAAWQRPDYVLKGLPWGDGKSGDATISSDPNVRMTVTGTDTELTSTVGANTLANGDLCFLHQTQGTGAGNYQWNMVSSGGGSTSIVWKKPLHYTFGTGAQCIKVLRYKIATVSAHSVTGWNGSIGGIEVILAKTSITVSGAINGNSAGFRLGAKDPNNSGSGWQGEGSISGPTQGNGGPTGSGAGFWKDTPGSGGGHAATGGGSRGGGITGSADLLNLTFGGGGSGGSSGNPAGDGTNGGGAVILIGKSITVSANVTVNSTQPAYASGRAGGSGAAGSVLYICNTASLGSGTAAVAASGGTSGEGNGGTGSVGRIAVHHSGVVTGTTNPTFSDTADATLIEKTGGAFLYQYV